MCSEIEKIGQIQKKLRTPSGKGKKNLENQGGLDGLQVLSPSMEKLSIKSPTTSPIKQEFLQEPETPEKFLEDQSYLNDVHLSARLGEGQFGVVYSGDWMGTLVALKHLNPEQIVKEMKVWQ